MKQLVDSDTHCWRSSRNLRSGPALEQNSIRMQMNRDKAAENVAILVQWQIACAIAVLASPKITNANLYEDARVKGKTVQR